MGSVTAIRKQLHNTDVVVGSNVRKYRKMRDMTQTELGEKIGVSFQQLQKYERGTNRISAGALHKIAGVLSVTSILDLFEGVSVELTERDMKMLAIGYCIGCDDAVSDDFICKKSEELMRDSMFRDLAKRAQFIFSSI